MKEILCDTCSKCREQESPGGKILTCFATIQQQVVTGIVKCPHYNKTYIPPETDASKEICFKCKWYREREEGGEIYKWCDPPPEVLRVSVSRKRLDCNAFVPALKKEKVKQESHPSSMDMGFTGWVRGWFR